MAGPKIRVLRLAHVHYQHPDLASAERFFLDFGFVEAHRENSIVYYRGFGEQPYIYAAEPSPDGKRHFMGGTWVVESEAELARAAHAGSTSIVTHEGPGGGKIVTIKDPYGMNVSFIHGQTLHEPDVEQQIDSKLKYDPDIVANTVYEKRRRGKFVRLKAGASKVHKLGHYGFVVEKSRFEEMVTWYTNFINLKPTDAVFNQTTGKDETCFFHMDRGMEYTDHHSFFLATGPDNKPAHVHHSSFEVNDFDTQELGHVWLEQKGWTNCWGIGRHVLGSQIFDYWFDSSGNVVEHYADGDLVNQDTPFTREPACPASLYIWGPNIPLAFVTGKIEDALSSAVVAS